ncbi:MAG: hypothetical protein ABIQ09_09980 [Jatrophihabitantaceae bacterium]
MVQLALALYTMVRVLFGPIQASGPSSIACTEVSQAWSGLAISRR